MTLGGMDSGSGAGMMERRRGGRSRGIGPRGIGVVVGQVLDPSQGLGMTQN